MTVRVVDHLAFPVCCENGHTAGAPYHLVSHSIRFRANGVGPINSADAARRVPAGIVIQPSTSAGLSIRKSAWTAAISTARTALEELRVTKSLRRSRCTAGWRRCRTYRYERRMRARRWRTCAACCCLNDRSCAETGADADARSSLSARHPLLTRALRRMAGLPTCISLRRGVCRHCTDVRRPYCAPERAACAP